MAYRIRTPHMSRRFGKKASILFFSLPITLLLIGVTYVAMRGYYGAAQPTSANSQQRVTNQSVSPEASITTVPPRTIASPPSPANGSDYVIPPVRDGVVPVITHIPTKKPVAFLTIDDGIVTNRDDTSLMEASHTKATFFLVYRFVNSSVPFFNDLASQTGSDIENHTYDHYLLPNLTYDQQKVDICKNADVFQSLFGKRPVLLRPSGGAYNATTLRAAADCGMKALIMWDASINNGTIKYQHGNQLQPGDIVLMHFRTTFPQDLNAFVTAANDAGLQPDLLTNWLSDAD